MGREKTLSLGLRVEGREKMLYYENWRGYWFYMVLVLKSTSKLSCTENDLSCVKTNLQVCWRDCPILMRYKNLLILILSLLGDYPSGRS